MTKDKIQTKSVILAWTPENQGNRGKRVKIVKKGQKGAKNDESRDPFQYTVAYEIAKKGQKGAYSSVFENPDGVLVGWEAGGEPILEICSQFPRY